MISYTREAAGGRQCPLVMMPAALEVTQSRGQDVCTDPGKVLTEVGVALWAVDQLAYDEQRPSVAHQVEGMGDWTVLVISPVHANECSASTC